MNNGRVYITRFVITVIYSPWTRLPRYNGVTVYFLLDNFPFSICLVKLKKSTKTRLLSVFLFPHTIHTYLAFICYWFIKSLVSVTLEYIPSFN